VIEILYTIGTSGKSLGEFVGHLRAAGIDRVIDTRLQNTSHLAGFTKREHLEFLLTDLLGIGYRHEPDLAPAPELLEAFRRSRDWGAYERGFARLIEERGMADILEVATRATACPCLLCACPGPEQCHRRLLAEAVATSYPGLRVEHLR
jgi:uncharacterized protein (DUF488 family)